MTPAPLVLHVLSAAGLPSALPLAAAALGLVLCWRGARHGRSARRAARAALAAIALLAVLPSIVPYDHLLPGAHDSAPAAEATHEQHCHGTPGSCADAPLAAGPGQLILSGPLVVAPAMLALLVALTLPVLAGVSPRPPTRPPRPAGAAT